MKKVLSFVFLLAVLLGACQKDEGIGHPELLYKRWYLSRTRLVDNTNWLYYDTDGIYDTEYRPDGRLVHRKDGVIRTMPCCSATKFERSGKKIKYLDFEVCSYAQCSSLPENEATITYLSNELLELTTDQRVAQYTAVR
jgi:hypothetical protein